MPERDPAAPTSPAGSRDPEAHGWLQGFYGGPDELAMFGHDGVRLGATDGVPEVAPEEVASVVAAVRRSAAGLTFGGHFYRVDRLLEPQAVVAVPEPPGDASFAELVAAVTDNLAIVGLMRNPGKAAKAVMLLRQMVDHYEGAA